ncbi:MAG: helix-turn-helix domain-containing protein [Mesorhizobium sp.]|nr:MAG: helix-turn-helix domain-containing protein [Mesorhizobium sp.]TIM81085.1 MAG: helix-turn-helix domain-containing protein [Mesorhizobium sp.]
MSVSAELIREHTRTKFELLDAISMDPRVTAGEFRVAYRLAQHANAETGAIFPSQDRLASQVGMKERSVRACIASLVSKGWLRKRRPNRRTSNSYSFDTTHINAILDRQITLNEARKEERKTRARPKP